VETINRDPGLNFLTVKVKPFANLDSTRLVLLVKPSSRERIGLNKTESAGASF
jgi:cell shape-determining protein MreC